MARTKCRGCCRTRTVARKQTGGEFLDGEILQFCFTLHTGKAPRKQLVTGIAPTTVSVAAEGIGGGVIKRPYRSRRSS